MDITARSSAASTTQDTQQFKPEASRLCAAPLPFAPAR